MKQSLCVFVALLRCFPAAAEQAGEPEPAGQPLQENRLDGSARGPTERPRYALPPGKVQLGGLFGGSYLSAGAGHAQPALGAEFVVGLPRNLAFFGEVARHNSVDLGELDLRLGTDFYDLGAGVEWNLPNRTRVTPYLRTGFGLVHLTAVARFARDDFWASGNKLAGNFGGGLRIHLTENYGFLFDLRGFHGPDLPSMGRTSFGFFYQFK